jgi:hypothetical protein
MQDEVCGFAAAPSGKAMPYRSPVDTEPSNEPKRRSSNSFKSSRPALKNFSTLVHIL